MQATKICQLSLKKSSAVLLRALLGIAFAWLKAGGVFDILKENLGLEETYMIDFIAELFVEIADLFITFWVDKVIAKFAKKK